MKKGIVRLAIGLDNQLHISLNGEFTTLNFQNSNLDINNSIDNKSNVQDSFDLIEAIRAIVKANSKRFWILQQPLIFKVGISEIKGKDELHSLMDFFDKVGANWIEIIELKESPESFIKKSELDQDIIIAKMNCNSRPRVPEYLN